MELGGPTRAGEVVRSCGVETCSFCRVNGGRSAAQHATQFRHLGLPEVLGVFDFVVVMVELFTTIARHADGTIPSISSDAIEARGRIFALESGDSDARSSLVANMLMAKLKGSPSKP